MTDEITISSPKGDPASISRDLNRADAEEAERTDISYDEEEDTVVVTADDDSALDWLYGWLEEIVQFYRENFDEARSDIAAARQLAEATYEETADTEEA